MQIRGSLSALAVLVALFAVSPAPAAPPEVTGVRLVDETTLVWDAAPGAAGHHVYRTEVEALPSSYGTCLVGSISGTSADVPDSPLPGAAFAYLVSAFDADGEGSLGTASDETARVADESCVPARRLFALTPNGDPGDGAEDGVTPRRNPSLEAWSVGRGAAGLDLHTGELWVEATDLRITGRVLHWSFERRYQSQISYDGPLGRNWDFRDNARLARDGQDIVHFDGTGRREVFRSVMGGFASPPGQYGVLHENADGSYTIRRPRGLLRTFFALDGSHVAGALESAEDRFGNRIQYLYEQ
ncbi:MAG: hypothetical protein JSV80_00425, partial [Acidobacteriota bacterium]